MQNLLNNLSIKQKIAILVFILLIPVMIIISIIVMNISALPMAKIRNLDEYLTSASGAQKRELQQGLYAFLSGKTDANIDDLDIYIRDGSFEESDYDNNNRLVRFIIDIDEIKASYEASYVFPGNEITTENPVFDCPAVDDMKYPETECVGMYNSSKLVKEEKANPVNEILPIKVDEFDTETGVFTKFDIYGYFDSENEDKFNISIVDYSCDNREKALQMIRDKGFNPDDYEIKYQDECYTKHLPHTGTNSLGNKYRVDVTSTDEGKLYFLIDNYACSDKTATEEASVKAAEDWLLSRGIKLSNYEYGVLTFCTR